MSHANTPLATKMLGATGIEVTTLGAGCTWLGGQPDGTFDEESGVAAVRGADGGVP